MPRKRKERKEVAKAAEAPKKPEYETIWVQPSDGAPVELPSNAPMRGAWDSEATSIKEAKDFKTDEWVKYWDNEHWEEAVILQQPRRVTAQVVATVNYVVWNEDPNAVLQKHIPYGLKNVDSKIISIDDMGKKVSDSDTKSRYKSDEPDPFAEL